MKAHFITTLLLLTTPVLFFTITASAQQADTLNARQQQIVTIASLTAKGDLDKLKPALAGALDAGLTINETKEVIVHLYAYCGFPRSIQGLNTLISVLDQRKAKGINDITGKKASPIQDTGRKYQRGKKVLETLSGQPQGELRGYAAFSPEIEIFLKEHLFADIFERDILNYAERELTTVSVLVTIGGVEPMMQSHMGLSLRNGISRNQLAHLLDIIELTIGKAEADIGRRVLLNIGGAGASTQAYKTDPVNLYSIFPKGEKAPEANFTGDAWVHPIIAADSNFNVPIVCVVFVPGARSNWHSHPGGQSLIAIEGTGYYQERGKPIRILRKGDAVRCPPNTPHWHGASPEQGFTQMAITPNTVKGRVTWMEKVTEKEYRSMQ